jgi:uncharacterized protein (TIGR00369 family)
MEGRTEACDRFQEREIPGLKRTGRASTIWIVHMYRLRVWKLLGYAPAFETSESLYHRVLARASSDAGQPSWKRPTAHRDILRRADDVQPPLRQQHGYVHAGALTTIADHTCGGAAVTTVPEGHEVITVENKVSFLRPASGSEVFCRAEVLRAGRTLVFVEAEVMVEGEAGRVIVAKACSTLAIIPLRPKPSI